MVHKKLFALSTRFYVNNLADSEPNPIYQGTHAVTCKRHLVYHHHRHHHRLVHKFFAKYILQIGYLTYCTQ